MADIKIKAVIRGTIKTIDRAAIADQRIRTAMHRIKERAAESDTSQSAQSAEAYSTEKVQKAMQRLAEDTVRFWKKKSRSSFRDTQQGMRKLRESVQELKDLKRKAPAQRTAQPIKEETVPTSRKRTIKTAQHTGRETIKTAQRPIKTAESTGKAFKRAGQTEKMAIKTSQEAAKAAKTGARASAKAAERAAHTARANAKGAAKNAKKAAKAVKSAIKAIIASAQTLTAMLTACGTVGVTIIVFFCLIGMLVGSVFGIFFADNSNDAGAMSLQAVVQEINFNYAAELQARKDGAMYDVLEMSGSRAVWPEVLSVYAVKLTTDPENPQEVTTMDESKKQMLTAIFWEMNSISSRIETRVETLVTDTVDSHGNIVQMQTEVTRTYLFITVSHKTAKEIATEYGFTQDQMEQLDALLSGDNTSMWAYVLNGIAYSDDEIVSVALSQVGNTGGQPYWSWYGFASRVDWCACFVSWCANQCGYLDNGVIPKFCDCPTGAAWFQQRGQWLDNSAVPSAGMIIFFDFNLNGLADHVGIVVSSQNGTVYTVEGNSGDSCKQKQYQVGSYTILGYGVPAY